MRQVLLAGTYYKITGDIIKRAINPWKAKVMSTAGREYSDFGQADLEEYHDFRNGIGLESALPSESARLWWTEGIDFSTARSAVLGPLVNTADYDTWEASHDYALLNFVIPTTPNGYCYECTTDAGSSDSSEPTWPTPAGQTVVDDGITWTCRAYLATVKIIDFKGDDSTKKTYIIQNSRILKWDGTNLDCVDNTLADPIDAIVVTDSTDEYLIVSSATEALYTTDGTTWTALMKYITPDTTDDPDTEWTDDDLAIDDVTGTYAEDSVTINDYGSFLELRLTNPVWCSSIRYYASRETADITKIYIDVYYAAAWHNIYNDTVTVGAWTTATITGGPFLVSKARVKFFNAHMSATRDGRLNEFDFINVGFGHMADYDNRLRFITTDGKVVSSSDAKDIDELYDCFELTGNYGTVYDFFEGKLLADGTPTVYFTGTQGLFTLDITNEKTYKQEVAYPPLTYAGHKGLYWNANVWVATGYGILKVAPSMASFVGPDQDDGLPSDYQGYIYDMVTVNNWLVFCVNGGTSDNSSILKRNSSLGGNLQVYTTTRPHKASDTANIATSVDATTLAALLTLINEIKGDYNTHRASTTYHVAADSTNAITSDDAAGANWAAAKASVVALVNELKADYNAHRTQSGVHINNDGSNIVTSDDASTDDADETESKTLANEIKADYNAHVITGGQQIACLHHSPSSLYTNGRLWFGEGTIVRYMMFPDTTHNVKQISGYEYVDDSGYGKLPILRKLAAISKTALGVAAITKSCDTNEYVQVFYGINGAAPTTSLGTFKSSPRAALLTFGTLAVGVEFYTIQFAIKLFRGDTDTNSPELESLIFYYMPTPTRISAWTFNVEATEATSQAIIEAFETLQDTNTLVPFFPSGDKNKDSFNVKLTTMPGGYYWENQGGREGRIQVTVEEIFKG